jgi:hypothetical protein
MNLLGLRFEPFAMTRVAEQLLCISAPSFGSTFGVARYGAATSALEGGRGRLPGAQEKAN